MMTVALDLVVGAPAADPSDDLDLDDLARAGANNPERLQLDGLTGRQRIGGGFASGTIISGEELQPAGIDEGAVILVVQEIGDQSDLVEGQAGAFDQAAQIA